MELNQIWHCPRPALAKRYLALLQAGPVVSTTIFAPRRTGKTVFLRKDLTPAADAAGFTVAYVDLWQTRLNPGIDRSGPGGSAHAEDAGPKGASQAA